MGEAQRYINPNLVINGKVHNYAHRKDLDPATGGRWYGPDICNRHALAFIDLRSGLDTSQLDAEQRAAYEQLGRVITTHNYVPVSGLKIVAPIRKLEVGASVTMQCELLPAKATRQNII